MMADGTYRHRDLAAGSWQQLSRAGQLANVDRYFLAFAVLARRNR